jgi:cytochrome c-type biogenesis protein
VDFSLIIPSFIAGVLTFLAPCTLPLVPGYLGFISGTSINKLRKAKIDSSARKKVFINGIFYVLGFSLVFIVFGTLIGSLGTGFAKYRLVLTRVGGVVVILFGLYMMRAFNLPIFNFLNKERRFNVAGKLEPGNPLSSLIFGSTFAFGWTPCIGPILGTILILVSTTGTVVQGAFLLFIFSLGLAVPFLLVAAGVGTALNYLKKISKYLNIVSFIGGLFLVIMGFFLVTNRFAAWISYSYQLFSFINYEMILDYL